MGLRHLNSFLFKLPNGIDVQLGHSNGVFQLRQYQPNKYRNQLKLNNINILIIIHHMTFTKFVEVGRVARINYGPQEGKLAVIVDILNENRVLVDGDHIERQLIPIRRLQLTRFTVPVGRGARTGTVRKIVAAQKLQQNWNKSASGKLYAARARRATLNDFERFKVMVLRKRLSKLLNVKPKVQVKAVNNKKEAKKKQ